MTWSFDPTLAADLDKVRFLCGDVDTADQLVANETITGTLTMYGNVYRTGAAVCRHLAARFSRQADIAEDDLSKKLSQRASAFADRAKELDAQATMPSTVLVPVLFAGGISVADKEIREQDDDRVQPFFRRDSMDVPGSNIVDPLALVEDDDL